MCRRSLSQVCTIASPLIFQSLFTFQLIIQSYVTSQLIIQSHTVSQLFMKLLMVLLRTSRGGGVHCRTSSGVRGIHLSALVLPCHGYGGICESLSCPVTLWRPSVNPRPALSRLWRPSESSSCPVTAMEAVCESSSCPVTAMEAV